MNNSVELIYTNIEKFNQRIPVFVVNIKRTN